MKSKLLRLITVLTLSGIALSLTAWAIASTAGSQERVNHQKVDPASYPVTDFDTPEPTDPIKRELQRARNRQYDIGDKRIKTEDLRKFALEETDPPELLQLIASEVPPEPALPIPQSDAIAVVEVTKAEAHLSNDRTNVYSEFQVRVEEVLKNDKFRSLGFGSVIATTRQGGRVRFPSGKTILRGSVGKNMPRSGARYLFFLKYDDEGQNYPIITAYELRNARVFPLDSVGTGGNTPYESAEEASFISEVRAAIETGLTL